MQRTLDAFTEGMALVRNRRWDYLAANALGRAVYAEVFDGRNGPPNHVRYVFLDDRARTFFDDWAAVAHDTAQLLRSEAGRDPHDPSPAELIEELSAASAEFRDVWAQHDVRLRATGRHHVHTTSTTPTSATSISSSKQPLSGLTRPHPPAGHRRSRNADRDGVSFGPRPTGMRIHTSPV